MTRDIFHWQMSAIMHKSAVMTLQTYIVDAYQSVPQGSVPIVLLFALLPLHCEQADEAIGRGSIQIIGQQWQNITDSDLLLDFADPVLKDFTSTLPAALKGTLNVEDSILKIYFDPAIPIEIERLAELGVNRSKYQLLTKMEVSSQRVISYLKDKYIEEKEVWIEALFEQDLQSLFSLSSEDSIKTFSDTYSCPPSQSPSPSPDPGGPSGPGPSDKNWYVFKRQNDGCCFLHDNPTYIYQALIYDRVYGPDTYQNCSNWANTNCDC
jgi:hypothetical protein